MTNEILSVVLCFVSGVVVASIVMVILGIKNEIKGLQKQAEEFKLQNETNNTLFREVEELHRKVGDGNDKIYRTIHEQNVEIYRYIDSRIDKLDNKLTGQFEPVKSK